MEPACDDAKDHARESWIVWRIDDNGNTFVVQDGLSERAARQLVEVLTARGHKQTYWAEQQQP
jgi:hypothetical protein